MSEPIPALVLYDFPAVPADERWPSYSPFVLEVERALHLARLEFRRQRISMTKLRQLNPVGQLPVVRFGPELVADSTRILRRIEQIAPGSLTAGLEPGHVAEAWLWEELADTALYPYVLATRWVDARGFQVVREAFFGTLPRPLRLVLPPLIRRRIKQALIGRDFLRAGLSSLNERFDRLLDDLEGRAPDHGFWLGPQVTVADLGLFAQLHSLRMPATPWREAELRRRPRLWSWLDRVEAATQPSHEPPPLHVPDASQLN